MTKEGVVYLTHPLISDDNLYREIWKYIYI